MVAHPVVSNAMRRNGHVRDAAAASSSGPSPMQMYLTAVPSKRCWMCLKHHSFPGPLALYMSSGRKNSSSLNSISFANVGSSSPVVTSIMCVSVSSSSLSRVDRRCSSSSVFRACDSHPLAIWSVFSYRSQRSAERFRLMSMVSRPWPYNDTAALMRNATSLHISVKGPEELEASRSSGLSSSESGNLSSSDTCAMLTSST
mmetsp:Transcript_7212/g.13078  ORF Transcript_7212/g.13078 Transcript_7212/m.13078 type:complete len:201 (-) Transcript_7212:352-954(-)